jgi:hypothetical protein
MGQLRLVMRERGKRRREWRQSDQSGLYGKTGARPTSRSPAPRQDITAFLLHGVARFQTDADGPTSARDMDDLSKLVVSKRLRANGRAYHIKIFCDVGGFVGQWKCPACRLEGRAAVRYAVVESAEGWAQRAVMVHHAAVHEAEEL